MRSTESQNLCYYVHYDNCADQGTDEQKMPQTATLLKLHNKCINTYTAKNNTKIMVTSNAYSIFPSVSHLNIGFWNNFI